MISIFVLLLCIKSLKLLEIIVLDWIYVDFTCFLNIIFLFTLVKFQRHGFCFVIFLFLVRLLLILYRVFFFFLNFISLSFNYDVCHILKFVYLILLIIILNCFYIIHVRIFLLILIYDTNIVHVIFLNEIIGMWSQKRLLGSRRSHCAALLEISNIRL